jgi:hypothetical protein
VEFRSTVPPAPLASAASGLRPVVASIGELMLISPVVLTAKSPPFPAGIALLLLSPPLKVTGP